jgi:hypothetical protein
MEFTEGTFTIETLANALNLTRGSTINYISKLKKANLVMVSGGGRQKKIYKIRSLPFIKTNGFYDLVNKYSKIKLVPKFNHIVHGSYSIEKAIIDGLFIGDARTLEATSYLFKQVKNWPRLMNLAKKFHKSDEVRKLYEKARANFKCRKMPKRYLNKN